MFARLFPPAEERHTHPPIARRRILYILITMKLYELMYELILNITDTLKRVPNKQII